MPNGGPHLYCASPLSYMSQRTYQPHTVLVLLVQGEKLITCVLDI